MLLCFCDWERNLAALIVECKGCQQYKAFYTVIGSFYLFTIDSSYKTNHLIFTKNLKQTSQLSNNMVLNRTDNAVIASVMISVSGTIANSLSLSYFVRRSDKNLGNLLLMLLNSLVGQLNQIFLKSS